MSLERHNHQKLHDPKYVGPGIWIIIHMECKNADTPEKKGLAIAMIRRIQAGFPCDKCKGHFGRYLELNPPETTINDDPRALFRWSVEFHNAVNSRKSKAQVPYEEAELLYYRDSNVAVCSAACEESSDDSKSSTSEPVGSLTPHDTHAPLDTRVRESRERVVLSTDRFSTKEITIPVSPKGNSIWSLSPTPDRTRMTPGKLVILPTSNSRSSLYSGR